MNIYLTADIEIWCDGWQDIDSKFPGAFSKYIYGKTPSGDFGLQYQLERLKEHQLKCTFFVEPLFSLRFGMSPLKEIVDLIQSYGQRVELHTHTEWLDEAIDKPFPHIQEKRQHIKYFNLEQQTKIIGLGKRLLEEAGANNISAYRAGSFAFNLDTIEALSRNSIYIDASYNETQFGKSSCLSNAHPLITPFNIGDVKEFPMTAYHDGGRNLRHAQLSACSYGEISTLLRRSLNNHIPAITFLFHNFELLNQSKTKPDRVAVRRFNQITQMLENNRELMPTLFLCDDAEIQYHSQAAPITTPLWKTAIRMSEQLYRKRYE